MTDADKAESLSISAEAAPEVEAQPENAVQLHLPIFEGPFDLLLHLIKENEIDIYDIPIVQITEQYLAYLHQMEELDLEVASSFLVMAANLLAIKARMLLPKPPVEEEEEDARAELVHDILEYMRFKDAAETLGGLKEQHSLFIARPNEAEMYEKLFADQVILEDKTLVDLTNAFAAILRQVEERGEVIDIAKEQVTVRDKLLQLYESLSANPQGQSFESFFAASASRIEVIVTFLAMLELSRRGILRVSQSSEYGRIYLYPAELERFAELGLANADLGEY
ncbi:MAG: segregation/condensation protein A [Firmicutes bacterium]|nr:segregation/condensation protein A [Bacillota bacterium]